MSRGLTPSQLNRRSGNVSFPILDILSRSGDIRDQSRKLKKLIEILHVFGPIFFWGGSPEFLDLHYKIRTVSDHEAKFQGDRSRNLGERRTRGEKKKNICGET